MAWLIGFCGIILAFAGWQRDHVIYNPLTFFALLWGLISIGAGMQLFGMYGTSNATYAMVLLGLLSFAAGTFFGNMSGKRCSAQAGSVTLNYKLVYVLGIIAVIYMGSLALVALSYLLRGYSLIYIRFSLFNNKESEMYGGGGLMYSIRYFIIQPILSYLPIICIVDMIIGKKDKFLLCISIAALTLLILTSGGRLPILYVLIDILIVFMVSKKRIHFPKQIKKLILGAGTVAVAVIVVVTFARGVSDLAQNYYKYFVGCMPHVDRYYLPKVRENHYWALGACVFKAPIQLVFLVLKKLHIVHDYPAWFYTITEYLNTEPVYWIGRGTDMRFNGFVTVFYYFYLDFHYVSVVLYSFLFGFWTERVFIRAARQVNARNMALLCIAFQMLTVSFARFEPVITRFFITMLMIAFSYHRPKKITSLWDISVTLPNIRLTKK